MSQTAPKKILIIYYSFSGQTNGLLRRMKKGIEQSGHRVIRERLVPTPPLQFPVGSIFLSIKMMIKTFFRQRIAIRQLSEKCKGEFDLIIIAGPTWSYNPSGPILSLIDRDGQRLFNGKTILPIISCRGYWRLHWYGLRAMIKKCGGQAPNLMVFSHPNPEPWRTIGVFLKIAGKTPEKSIIRKYYRKYGHSGLQQEEAERFGETIGKALHNNTPIDQLNFSTPLALP